MLWLYACSDIGVYTESILLETFNALAGAQAVGGFVIQMASADAAGDFGLLGFTPFEVIQGI